MQRTVGLEQLKKTKRYTLESLSNLWFSDDVLKSLGLSESQRDEKCVTFCNIKIPLLDIFDLVGLLNLLVKDWTIKHRSGVPVYIVHIGKSETFLGQGINFEYEELIDALWCALVFKLGGMR